METKHTPGPWHNSNVYVKTWDGIPINCTADRTDETPEGYTYQVAIVPAFAEPSEEQYANARLIASAPDLLAACADLLKYLNLAFDVSENDLFGEEHNDVLVAMDRAENAIAKATGVQQ